ncbi:MAG: hypothetical protein LBV14_11445 [Acidovorax sp.]|nr:hypothetical protein [Acidovorax sp.]
MKDVAQHIMEPLNDNGVYRHLRFREPGTMCMHFDLVTWPGHLCYTGDMGTFVFTRVYDMLNFFRTERRVDGTFSIDHRYWAEKCEGQDKCDGLREFDADAFKREITQQRRRLFLNYAKYMDADMRRDFWGELEDVKRSANDGEHATYAAVQDWSFEINKPSRWSDGNELIHIDTDDFPSCKQYTMRFLWCCQALAWGIEKYDAAKEEVPA